MVNYVIINGVNSNTISGLAINELPPITKPLQRTLIEEIDGRDGDIITKLGYGAYDKIMTIGLYHTYDINKVVAFFNGSGTITFSNESDKYYNFDILDQIDYEKLLSFKTATVTIHCQPFKYPTTNTPISLSTGDNTVANSGNVYSKPIIKIVGSGTITVSLGSSQIFSIDMTDLTNGIEIDTNLMEAYDPVSNTLLNRHVTGDYSKFKLEPGNNTVTLGGTITSATIKSVTRWL